MKPNVSISQFVKDGLVGIVVTLLINGALISLLYINNSIDFNSSNGSTVSVGPDFRLVLILVLVATFIGVGSGSQFLEAISARVDWILRILPIIGISCLVGLMLSLIFVGRGSEFYLFLNLEVVASCAGAFIGSLFGVLAGIILNPTKRFYRIIIGAISSAMVGIGLEFGILVSVIMLNMR